MKTKKIVAAALTLVLAVSSGALAGCGESTGSSEEFDKENEIKVISREEGSGTRGAFIELFGIEEKGDDGSKTDHTTKDAVIANQTEIMMKNVSGDDYAIGYVSLGSLNDTVKAVKIDGAEATTDNVVSGEYTVSRPFNIVTKGAAAGLAKDFIDFILSDEGQQVVADNKYIPMEGAQKANLSLPSGKIVVAGSSSVTPVMEKLKEAYLEKNKGANIEIQMSDSSAGISAALEGTCDIGMASRELKPEEAAELTPLQIAIDGIAVIINKNNSMDDLSKDAVKQIFSGDVTTWSEV
ncbi:MAG: substrate-binding domain-containing protein [Clostridiales Family XIII bacterium]|jgi:phosphate transport system substrate-binding protein|nr:substrate-binding domain-containing protein [Clostridiales Family XIII bacterium]